MRSARLIALTATTLLIGTGIVVGVSTGTAQASIPDPSGVVHACYLNLTGAVTVIDTQAGQACIVGQTGLNWNQQGVAGAPGLAGVNVQHSTTTSTQSNTSVYTETTFDCTGGQTVLFGNGVLHATGNGNNTLIPLATDGYHVSGSSVIGMKFLVPNNWSTSDTIDIYIECATTS